MKKILIIILLLCCGLLVLASCQMSAPTNLKIVDGVLSWDEVKGANSYTVEINGKEYECAENSFTLPDDLYGQVNVKVTAHDGNGNTVFAELKTTVTITLPTPDNIRQESNVITWDAVKNAQGYVVKINGVEHAANENRYVLPDGISGSLSVLASGTSDGIILPSEYSVPFIIKTTLNKPTGITVSNGVITWNKVENADKYIVTLNNEIVKETASNFLSVKYQVSGLTNVKIKAVSANENILDSDFAETILDIEKLTLSAPKNVTVDGKTLTFEAVEGAVEYEIYQNGQIIATVSVTSYAITNEQFELGGYIEVKAISPTAIASKLSDKVLINITEISSESELRAMTKNGCYRLTCDITLTGKWTPLDFCGVFDGGGHTIDGIAVEGDYANAGFFAILDGASVKNITLKGSVTIVSDKADACVGGIAGKAVDSAVSGCAVQMNVTVTFENGVGNAGGVVGATVNSSFYKVGFAGKIAAVNAVTGGFAGKAYSPIELNSIEKCVVSAEITCVGGEQAASGGFIGSMTDNCLTISQCSASVTIKGNAYVGGFVGYMGTGRIDNCLAEGSVSSDAEALAHVGGFVGRLEGYNNKISYCISMCAVTCNSAGENIFVGGFAGKTVGGTYGSIYSDCVYDKTVCDLDRIGNASSGRGDGISSKSTDEMKRIATFSSFDASLWNLADGSLPSIKL